MKVTLRLSTAKPGSAKAYSKFFTEHGEHEQAARLDDFALGSSTYELTSLEIAMALYPFIFDWGRPADIIPLHKLLEDSGKKPPLFELTKDSDVGWLLLDTRSTNAFNRCDLTTDPQGIRTVGQLLQLSVGDLVHVDKLGTKGIALVKERVALYNFTFSR